MNKEEFKQKLKVEIKNNKIKKKKLHDRAKEKDETKKIALEYLDR